MSDHVLGHLKVGDDSVGKGSDGLDAYGGTPDHLFGIRTEGDYLLLALSVDVSDCNDGRLIDDDAFGLHVNDCVYCTNVYTNFIIEQVRSELQHPATRFRKFPFKKTSLYIISFISVDRIMELA
jgi:hypothetical protein